MQKFQQSIGGDETSLPWFHHFRRDLIGMIGNDRIQSQQVSVLRDLVIMVLPSREVVDSFALPVQRTRAHVPAGPQ